MALELLKEDDKKTLGRLAVEFGDHFLDGCNGNEKIICLYGANRKILNFFKKQLRVYLLEDKKKDVPVVFREGSYDIDVGFFLRTGYFKGLNDE